MSLFDDKYRTITKPAEGVFRDRGSKFIAYAYPLNDESDLKDLLTQVKSMHPKARHHCWALRLTPDRSIFRINDDGEPSGSAGRPILNVMLSLDVTNIVVIVVRYFGGTLLGVPGLINAYKTSTREALENADIVECTVNDIYSIAFDYLTMNDVMRIVKEEELQLLKQDFDNECVIEFGMPQSQVAQVVGKMEKLEGIRLQYLRTV